MTGPKTVEGPKTVAVIGAGPMGLATTRHLLAQGFSVQGYELHEDVGGLWDIGNPYSTIYASAHLISSKRMTEFADFPMRESVADYPHHRELHQYFRDYAEHFALRPHYRFGTRVVEVRRTANGQWAITSEPAQRASASTQTTTLVDAVCIATGTLHYPHLPTLPGSFSGTLLHSSAYRTPELFRDQRVLIVGCGNSGADIAVDAVHHARSVDLSVRRGYYFLPKYIMGRPTDTLGGAFPLPRPLKQRLDALLIRVVMGRPSNYGLPDPDYQMYEAHPVVNSLVLHHLGQGDITPRRDLQAIEGQTVTFTNGAQADYDVILLATGYELRYPFIDPAALNWPSGAAPQLYLNVFHPTDDTLFMMGMLEAAGLGWEGRNQQARLVALYLRHLAAGTTAARTLQTRKRQGVDPAVRGGYRYLPIDRMATYVHKGSYQRTVARYIHALELDG
ncbi:MAG: NAD(P)-binding domain-containing protein [Gemmatimonadaceae bacterium]